MKNKYQFGREILCNHSFTFNSNYLSTMSAIKREVVEEVSVEEESVKKQRVASLEEVKPPIVVVDQRESVTFHSNSVLGFAFTPSKAYPSQSWVPWLKGTPQMPLTKVPTSIPHEFLIDGNFYYFEQFCVEKRIESHGGWVDVAPIIWPITRLLLESRITGVEGGPSRVFNDDDEFNICQAIRESDALIEGVHYTVRGGVIRHVASKHLRTIALVLAGDRWFCYNGRRTIPLHQHINSAHSNFLELISKCSNTFQLDGVNFTVSMVYNEVIFRLLGEADVRAFLVQMSENITSTCYHAGLLLDECKGVRVEYQGAPVFNENCFHMERTDEFQVALFPSNGVFNIKVDLVYQASPLPQDAALLSELEADSLEIAVSPTDTVKKVLDAIVEQQKMKHPDCSVPALFVYDFNYQLSDRATWDRDVLESLRIPHDTLMHELLVHKHSTDFAAYVSI